MAAVLIAATDPGVVPALEAELAAVLRCAGTHTAPTTPCVRPAVRRLADGAGAGRRASRWRASAGTTGGPLRGAEVAGLLPLLRRADTAVIVATPTRGHPCGP